MEATTDVIQAASLGDVWTIGVSSDAVPSIVIFPPADDADATLTDGTEYEWTVPLSLAGRWVASVSSTEGVVNFVVQVTAAIPALGMPSLADLRGGSADRDDPDDLGYLGRNSWTDAEIEDALEAEAANQRRVCRVPAEYPADLRQALLRRVARNLALRKLPLMMQRGDAEQGPAAIPGYDAEIRRLEAGHRRLVTA